VAALAVAVLAAVGGLVGVRARGESPAADAVVVPVTAQLGDEVDPALSPDGRRVAFASKGGDAAGYGLYVAAATGGPPTRLTAGRGREREPAWSGDGRHVAFVRSTAAGHFLVMVPSRGGRERELAALRAGDVADLEWANRRGLLFFTDRRVPGGVSAVARLEARSGARAWVTAPPAGIYGDRDLAVSPDGRRVVFARARLPGLEDLWIAEAGRREPRRLTRDAASINGVAWLPATDEVLFSSSRDGSSRLWRLSLVPGARPRPARGLPDGALDPAYAPAARRLAFERRVFDTNVWRLPLDGLAARPRRLAASTRWDAQPALGPRGRLALVSDRGGPATLWTGWLSRPHELRPLALGGRIFGRPAWSPDGRRLAFTVLRGGQADVAVVDLVTGARRRVTASAANEVCPTFGLDGRSILYSSDAGGAWSLWEARERLRPRRVPGLGDGPVLCARLHGDAVFFVRPGSTGLWRACFAGAPVLVPGSEDLDAWSDWDLVDGMLYVRPVMGAAWSAYRLAVDPGATPRRHALPGVPPAPFAGLGLSVDPSANVLLFGALDGADGDLLRVDDYR
jgi:Tol biopolymer transport system component